MKILFFGDVVGRPGREALAEILPKLKKEYKPDLIFANGENSAHGVGITESVLKELTNSGIDFLTNGDHAFALNEAAQIYEDKLALVLRPLNWPGDVPGRGYELILNNAQRILLVSLIGRVFMRPDFNDPFKAIADLLDEYSLKGKEQGSEAVDAIIVDFHAEATSEKIALGHYLDGKVSALLGTHTHVQTSDERVLSGGTAYISDLGMVGPQDSVIGVDKQIIIKRYLTQRMWPMSLAKGRTIEVCGVLVEIDKKTGLAENIERIRRIVELD
ncbi:MAG: Metallophosphoesterase [Parcubacteria group bacterium GW2011_GWA2_42_11]|nr:MAG: Metallophosphoesterase [Parcubacteria group bacterium GW2011_GWA2_42_11]